VLGEAVLSLAGVVEVRVFRQQGQQLAQRLEFAQRQFTVVVACALQRQVDGGVPGTVDQFDAQLALLDMPGLANPRVVEAYEVARLAVVAEQHHFAGPDRAAQRIGKRGEVLPLGHAAALNTATSRNTQAGDAWPTKTAWFGSPLPQFTTPSTALVAASPTAARLRQKAAEIPR
jgi:hypothetical protein